MNETVNNVVTGGVGMSNVITDLTISTGGITANTFWNTISDVIPFVVIVFGVGFGLYILRRALRGAQKGKAKI